MAPQAAPCLSCPAQNGIINPCTSASSRSNSANSPVSRPSSANSPTSSKGSKSVPTLRATLDKPWLPMKDLRTRYAYWITYATVVVFGLGMGALRICLGQCDIILQDPRTLCSMLSEDFTGATTENVFGDNGQLVREVDMSGFGFGRVKIRAKLSTSDWLSPALWMLPMDDMYASWVAFECAEVEVDDYGQGLHLLQDMEEGEDEQQWEGAVAEMCRRESEGSAEVEGSGGKLALPSFHLLLLTDLRALFMAEPFVTAEKTEECPVVFVDDIWRLLFTEYIPIWQLPGETAALYRHVNLKSERKALIFWSTLGSRQDLADTVETLQLSFSLEETGEGFWHGLRQHLPQMTKLTNFSLSYSLGDDDCLYRLIDKGDLAHTLPSTVDTLHLKPDYEKLQEACLFHRAVLWEENFPEDQGPWWSTFWRLTLSQIPSFTHLIITTPVYIIWPPTHERMQNVFHQWTAQLRCSNSAHSSLCTITINSAYEDEGL
ncbi:hypothetical protein C8J57DRAFT_1517981 [Mycena rebaudengoi]|nr:hypothetical protein C8J57DRAFT_1517981 [Mycena rebaudengoi]